MKVQFAGCGDAFGSGGRFNTCIHVEDGGRSILLDCGASSLLADIERQFVLAALEQTHGHLTNAAKLLGITFRAIRYKVKKHGLDRMALKDD